jgi:uroporphyrin-III C-methyltransferase
MSSAEVAKQAGRVFLIGAGPGDPKLLTIRAAEALADSDVVVYDYLVNPEVLVYSRQGVELVYVGKRAGEPSSTQAEINRILIDRALSGQTVARLKGGDPFVFGRGGEEAEALADAGIHWEVIPGVSSGVAAAAYAGIPLTHRDYASSVSFITGKSSRRGPGGLRRSAPETTLDRNSSDSLVGEGVGGFDADTLVIFMCAESIKTIARDLIAAGRSASTPVAIIRWGTYQNQEVYVGSLGDLNGGLDSAHDCLGTALDIRPPAIAIIGEVVALREKLKWFGHEREFSLATAGKQAEEQYINA